MEGTMTEKVFKKVLSDICRGCCTAMAVEHGHTCYLASAALLAPVGHRVEIQIYLIFVVKTTTFGDSPPRLDLAIVPATRQAK